MHEGRNLAVNLTKLVPILICLRTAERVDIFRGTASSQPWRGRLVAGIRAFCEEFTDHQGIQVDFAHETVPRAIPGGLVLCLFRVAQEGLRNVKRYSGANRAEVRLKGLGEKRFNLHRYSKHGGTPAIARRQPRGSLAPLGRDYN